MSTAEQGMKRIRTGLILLLAAATPAWAGPSCKESPKLVGSCFKFHGRLSIYNGACVERIWRVGTNRIVALGGVDGACNPALPAPIENRLKLGPDVAVFGDYDVCPLTRQRPGVMQLFCLAGESHLYAVSQWVGHPLLHP